MSKWEFVQLKEVCKVVSGTTPKSNREEYWNGTYNWVTPAELKEDTVEVMETERKITKQAIQDSGLKSFPAGTVLLSSRAPIGKVAIAGVEMYSNQGFKNLICSDQVFNQYLFWFLKGKNKYLNTLGRGATFKEISKSIVESVQIPLPPINEQKRIAKNLDMVSQIIKQYKKQLTEWDRLIQSVFYQIFGDPINNEKKWEAKKLGDICDITSSKRIFESEYVEEGIPFYRTKEIVELSKGSKVTTELFISNQRYKEIISKYEVPQIGDLLVSAVGTIGVIWVVNQETPFYFKDGNLLWIKRKGDVTSVFLRYLLQLLIEYYKKDITTGSTYSALTIVKLKQMNAYIPPLPLQNQFSKIVAKIEAQKLNVQKVLARTQDLFESLMQEFFK